MFFAMQNYHWVIDSEINQLVIELEAVKLLFQNLPNRPHIEENLRRHSLLKSAVYSARIEGLPDTLLFPKKESQNLLSAYHYLYSSSSPRKFNLTIVKKLHQLTLKGLSATTGQFRQETWAIFNQAGSVIHLAPSHLEVPSLMTEYLVFVNNLDLHPAVKSAIAQFIFEKIHPFADGNGRVGRLISSFVLEKSGFGFRGLSPFEEYLEANRDQYYYALEPSTDCTRFINFFLTALVTQSKKILSQLDQSAQESPEDTLLPRRREILDIIRDHPHISFDSLSRRFPQINPKTIHNDLSVLQKKNFVKKAGSTRGALYLTKTLN